MARRSKIPLKKEKKEEDLVLTKFQPSHPKDRHSRDELRLTKMHLLIQEIEWLEDLRYH